MLALAILTAIVTTLAFSGFWGLYRYRHLATSVTQWADEIPRAHTLTRNADALRAICPQLQHRGAGPLDANPLGAHWWHATTSESFRIVLDELQAGIGRYEDGLAASEAQDALLGDQGRQRQILDAIHASLKRVQHLYRADPLDADSVELVALQSEVDLLAERMQELPAFLQKRMSGFRDEVRGQYRTWITLAWSCAVLALLMVGMLLWLFRTLVVQPFRTLLAGSRLVASGQFDHRIDMGTGDELAELAQAMNGMTDRFQRTCSELETMCDDLDRQVNERTREVIQREQLASVGFLAAGVAHEINNPLASIAWSAEALESRLHEVLHSGKDGRSLSDDEADSLRTNLRRIQEEAFRCKGITERLLDFSRLGDVRLAPVDISELVRDVVAMVGTLGQYRCKTIRVDCRQSVVAAVNAQQIRQVALNLITNALESVDTDGAVDVRVRPVGGTVRIIVADDGCGMTAEVREHLFEPFFTRRRDGRGTGLGLSITYRIVSQHGGQITAYSDGPQRGSRLEVTLPLQPAEEQHDARKAAA